MVVDSPPGMTRPWHECSSSLVRTSSTDTPGMRRSKVMCSRKEPWSARTPTRTALAVRVMAAPTDERPAGGWTPYAVAGGERRHTSARASASRRSSGLDNDAPKRRTAPGIIEGILLCRWRLAARGVVQVAGRTCGRASGRGLCGRRSSIPTPRQAQRSEGQVRWHPSLTRRRRVCRHSRPARLAPGSPAVETREVRAGEWRGRHPRGSAAGSFAPYRLPRRACVGRCSPSRRRPRRAAGALGELMSQALLIQRDREVAKLRNQAQQLSDELKRALQARRDCMHILHACMQRTMHAPCMYALAGSLRTRSD
eukprot:359650-Chlamydomonas_euryale.AAC.8